MLVPLALRRRLVSAFRRIRKKCSMRSDPVVLAPIPYSADQLEAHTLDFFCWAYRPREGDTILDIGAGNGNELLCFSGLVGRRGLVHAVEAHPRAAAVARQMARRNRLRNVKVSEFAAWDERGSLHITDVRPGEGNDETNSVVDLSISATTVEVTARTLDEWADQTGIGAVDLLKMNIEGAEFPALRGATNLLRRTRNVAISCHDFVADEEPGHEMMRTGAPVRRLLEEHGFSLIARADDPRPFVRGYLYGTRSPTVAGKLSRPF